MNLYQLLPFAFLLCITQVFAQNKNDSIPKYIKVPAGYLMVLREGDDVFAELENLASKEQVPAANFTGMGFVNAKFGFFNFKTKEYDPKEFKDVELASMQGSIAPQLVPARWKL
jgi:predicted DNA-binding protein with PD1-like motif